MNIKTKNPDKYSIVNGNKVPVRRYDAVIIGSGAAGFGCAYALCESGVNSDNICIVTEGRNMGTSRNTGSDKQTYYKLAAADSAVKMAEDMTRAGSMHGDLAFVEAVNSLRGFHRLTTIGVPFPHDEYGEYTGYRTDHDTAGRATSCGPLTSKFMTEALEREVTSRSVPFYDGYRAVRLITENNAVCGVIAVSEAESNGDNEFGYAIFESANIVLAVGGPSAIYESTVYPISQTCALGLAFSVGAVGANLSESQYGLASVSPRWNVSGSYQQVLPRYFSTDKDGGDAREFLSDYIDSPTAVAASIFKKGYEWPFSPERVKTNDGYGSSAVDLAVFSETSRGRRVFLDFLHNPKEIVSNGKPELSLAGDEAYSYLCNCGSTGETPIDRLEKMNKPAIELYASYGVDLYKEPLEIAVSAQHCNGGVYVDKWYQSTVDGLFVIGEAAGVFGVQRPGGSALNSTQVGSIRAAEKIADRLYTKQNNDHNVTTYSVHLPIGQGDNKLTFEMIMEKRNEYAHAMTESCSFLRRPEKIKYLIDRVRSEIASFGEYGASDTRTITDLFINYDILITQFAMLNSVNAYINDGGLSRGSYLITDADADEILSSDKPQTDVGHSKLVGCVRLNENESGMSAETYFEACRPIPNTNNWFENVYNEYRNGNIFKK